MIGPHRDDIQFTIDGNDVRRHASRGEQKSVLLALKLVEFQYLLEKTNTRPLLLLDDMASELDSRRQQQFLTSLDNVGQTVMTTTQKQHLPGQAHVSFAIRNGNLVPWAPSEP